MRSAVEAIVLHEREIHTHTYTMADVDDAAADIPLFDPSMKKKKKKKKRVEGALMQCTLHGGTGTVWW